MCFMRLLFAAEALLSRSSRATDHPGEDSLRYLEHYLSTGWYHEARRWAQIRFGQKDWVLAVDPWQAN
jgi:hypothetical protein